MVGGQDQQVYSAAGRDVVSGRIRRRFENLWATGLRDALRAAGLVYAEQDYLTPEGLVALGALLGIEAASAG